MIQSNFLRYISFQDIISEKFLNFSVIIKLVFQTLEFLGILLHVSYMLNQATTKIPDRIQNSRLLDFEEKWLTFIQFFNFYFRTCHAMLFLLIPTDYDSRLTS